MTCDDILPFRQHQEVAQRLLPAPPISLKHNQLCFCIQQHNTASTTVVQRLNAPPVTTVSTRGQQCTGYGGHGILKCAVRPPSCWTQGVGLQISNVTLLQPIGAASTFIKHHGGQARRPAPGYPDTGQKINYEAGQGGQIKEGQDGTGAALASNQTAGHDT